MLASTKLDILTNIKYWAHSSCRPILFQGGLAQIMYLKERLIIMLEEEAHYRNE